MLVLRGCTELKIVGEHLYFLLAFFPFFFSLTDQNWKRACCRGAGGPDCTAGGVEGQQVSLQP